MDLKRDGIITLDEFLESCYNDETILASINVFGGVIAWCPQINTIEVVIVKKPVNVAAEVNN